MKKCRREGGREQRRDSEREGREDLYSTYSPHTSFSSSELSQQEVHGLSCILRRLTASFSIKHFVKVGSSQLESLIQVIAQLTCLCAQKIVQEEVSWQYL